MKLSRANGILSKLRYYVPLNTCISVYYSIFYSYVIYGSLAWSFTSQNNLNKLFLLQKKCVRILSNAKFLDHTDPLFISLNILKIRDILTSQVLKLVFQFYNDKLPSELQTLFVKNELVHSFNTRSSNLLHVPRVNTNHYGISSLKYNGPLTWNSFSHNANFLENSTSLNKLKSFLKFHFIQSYEE